MMIRWKLLNFWLFLFQVPQLTPDSLMISPVQQYSTTPLVTTMLGIPMDGSLASQTAQGLFPEIHPNYSTLSVEPPTNADLSADNAAEYGAESYQFLHLMQTHPNM